MHPFSKLLLLVGLIAAAPAAFGYEIPNIEVHANARTIPIRVTCNSPQLENLALQAFGSHGRYQVVNGGGGVSYNLRFTWMGGNQVRVDVTRGLSQENVVSQVVTGTSPRNALLRAADVAVERTNGQGLRGYFASKITFLAGTARRKEVYVGDLFCTEVQRLTNDNCDALFPRWSPDGRKIIYTSFLHGAPDIYLINLATFTRSAFAAFKGIDMSARFSPGGGRVAMVLSGTGSPEIWLSDPTGHGLVRLTHSDSAKSSPCWSPDGRKLLFAMEPGPHLYLMGAYPHSYPQRVAGGLSTYNAEPDWIRSRGKDLIAFTVREGGRFQIAVDEDFGQPKVVSQAPFDGVEASWLPDGRHLVYTARNAYTSQLCILDTETGRSTSIHGAASLGPTMEASVLAR